MPTEKELPAIQTERLILTIPGPEAAGRMVQYVEENREHLAPWEPVRAGEYYTEAFWREELANAALEFQRDNSMRLVLLSRENPSGPILGQCNFRNIIRGAFHACHLGYNLDGRAVGRGLMFEGLSAALGHAFEGLRLHRVMANYMPTNERSARLLRRLGFVVEGYARDYLKIGGAWRDHILTSLINGGRDGAEGK